MSTPETPSTSAWWVLESSAKRSSVKPLDQPQLPQRPRAIERLGEHPAGQPLELLVAARTRQGGVADVEGDVEVGVVDPHRPALAERHERQPLAVAGHQVEPRDDLLDELVVGRRRALEHHAAGDVHVRGVALEVQERAVEPGQPVRLATARILAGFGRCARGAVADDASGITSSVSGVARPAGNCCHPLRSIRPAESSLPGAGASGGPIAGLQSCHPAGANRPPGDISRLRS